MTQFWFSGGLSTVLWRSAFLAGLRWGVLRFFGLLLGVVESLGVAGGGGASFVRERVGFGRRGTGIGRS